MTRRIHSLLTALALIIAAEAALACSGPHCSPPARTLPDSSLVCTEVTCITEAPPTTAAGSNDAELCSGPGCRAPAQTLCAGPGCK